MPHVYSYQLILNSHKSKWVWWPLNEIWLWHLFALMGFGQCLQYKIYCNADARSYLPWQNGTCLRQYYKLKFQTLALPLENHLAKTFNCHISLMKPIKLFQLYTVHTWLLNSVWRVQFLHLQGSQIFAKIHWVKWRKLFTSKARIWNCLFTTIVKCFKKYQPMTLDHYFSGVLYSFSQ